jgi:hypothetical protein
MRKALGFALALTLALSLPALAEETKGTVKSVDPASQSFILEDGTQLWMSEGRPAELLPGDQVLATYAMKGDKKVVVELKRGTTSFGSAPSLDSIESPGN